MLRQGNGNLNVIMEALVMNKQGISMSLLSLMSRVSSRIYSPQWGPFKLSLKVQQWVCIQEVGWEVGQVLHLDCKFKIPECTGGEDKLMRELKCHL